MKLGQIIDGADAAIGNLSSLPPFVKLDEQWGDDRRDAHPDVIAFAEDVVAYYQSRLAFEEMGSVRHDGRFRLRDDRIWMGEQSKPIQQRGGYIAASEPAPFLCNTWYYIIFWDEYLSEVEECGDEAGCDPSPHHYLIFFDCKDFPKRQISPVQNVPVFTVGKMWSIRLPPFGDMFGWSGIVNDIKNRDEYVDEHLTQEDFDWGNERIGFYPLKTWSGFLNRQSGVINYPFAS